LKIAIDYDSSLPLEISQKQPLAMSKFLFSDRLYPGQKAAAKNHLHA